MTTMAYYEPQGWQAPASRQVSWEQPAPPSRSGSSSVSQREEIPAFSSQFDEVDRAIDNLVKSGKLWNAPRRDSMPMMMGRPYPEYDPRSMSTIPQRHHSISDFDGSRMHPSGNLQGFYAAQRFQNRPNEAEQMMQAKRRMAAQRERELRNYHQEQQYNRSLLAEVSANKSDRSLSPAAMSEESRRDLLARQRRALYGNDNPGFHSSGTIADEATRPGSQPAATPSSSGVRGPSPRGVDPFSTPQALGQANADVTAQATLQSPSRVNGTSSPSSGASQAFRKYDGPEVPATAKSSPGADSPSSRQPQQKPTTSSVSFVGTIGSRPSQQGSSAPATNPTIGKRSTTPLPSPLGYGFTPNETSSAGSNNDLSASSSSTSVAATAGLPGPKDPNSTGFVWASGTGTWGSKSGLGVQAPVWG